jgi:hypothetical protein
MRLIDPDSRDVDSNIEICLEELAITWGLDFLKIGGLALPPPASTLSHGPLPARYSPSTV